jgi:hypothetical protein
MISGLGRLLRIFDLALGQKRAHQLEYGIIGLGIIALVLIFQPFSLTLFGVGCAFVVLAGLVNNLLPLCDGATTVRTLVNAVLVVALTFCIVMLLSITSAQLYGALFVTAAVPDTSDPFYRQPFVWCVAALGVALSAAIALLRSARP